MTLTPNISPAPFIVIEGINGGGKSSLLSALSGWLTSQGLSFRCTREPGGTPLGQQLRSILLGSPTPLCRETEILLFLADRAEHVRSLIMPSLAQGTVVLCDRYTYSTVAFQGYGRGFDRERLAELNTLATGGLRPDLVILLDLPVEEALRRASARNQAPSSERDTFEEEDLAFHRRVREGFLDMAASLPEQFLILDAREKPETLLNQAQEAIARLLPHSRLD